MATKLLVIDDNENICDLLKIFFEKAFSVLRAKTVLIYCLIVRLCAITFMNIKFILWISLCLFQHQIITGYLSQNRCCGNAGKAGISFYHAGMRDVLIFIEAVAVD